MILMIHGIWQQKYIGRENELEEIWKGHLRNGLRAQGATDAEVEGIAGAAKMIFYADLTDAHAHQPQQGVKDPAVDAYENALKAEVEGEVQNRGLLNTKLAHILANWGNEKDVVSENILKLVAYEVYGYFANDTARSRVMERCNAVIGTSGVKMVIGHSMGTTVAYDLLKHRPDLAPHLITLGSPLGTHFINSRLETNRTPVFHGLQTWDDYADPEDIVSFKRIEAENMFHGYAGAPPAFQTTRNIENRTPNQHSIEGYLPQPVVTQRILELWRKG